MNDLLKIANLNKRFDGIKALDNFTCEVKGKEILGLIGPNGAGKSTLFNVITGFIPCDSGIATLNGRDILSKSPDNIARFGISRTFQNLRLIRQMTVFENVLLSFKNQKGEYLKNIFFNKKSSEKIEKENKERALSLLEYSGIAKKVNNLANDLSYGQQKLLTMVCCLAADAELILLDEPVAGIHPAMIDKIISMIVELPEKGKSVIIIEHNMDAIKQVCQRVIFMDEGAKVSEGTPDEVRNDPEVIEAYLD